MTISAARPHIAEGLPFPLGATWDGLGVNFALFSAHAAKVELCLFDDTGGRELHRIELTEMGFEHRAEAGRFLHEWQDRLQKFGSDYTRKRRA